MIIKKLTIYNMFAYRGKHEIDLSTSSGRNTVLIFAKNGRGKTSFLRIIRILIHGIKDNKPILEGLNQKTYVLGDGKDWDGLFNRVAVKEYSDKYAYVSGVLELEGKTLEIKREFKRLENTFDENAIISYNGVLETSNFIESILPKNFAHFFFFDGEKVKSLIDSSNLNIEDSLKTLLNITPYEKLRKDLKELKSKLQNEVKDAPTAEKLNRIVKEIEKHEADIAYYKKEIEKQEKEIKEKEREVKHTQEEYYNIKTINSDDLRTIRKNFEETKQKARELKEKLGGIIKNQPTLFMLMTYNLTKDYSKRINESSNNDKLDNQLEKFETWAEELKNKVFDQNDIESVYHLSLNIKRFYKKRITAEVERFITENATKQTNQIIIYHKDDKALLEKTLEKGPLLRKAMSDLLELNKRNTDLKYKLDAAEGDIDKQTILKDFEVKIRQVTQELSQLNISLGGLKKTKEETAKKKSNCDSELIVLRDKYERSIPTQKTLDKTNEYIKFFDHFIKTLLKSKIDLLKQSFNECLNKLIEKEMIEHVDIDDKFNITISDSVGQKGRKSISEGQKQLVTTALMQALNAITNVQSFVCIDSPLGRMDQDYKQKIIKHYYPNASKQVIILATSSEITKGSSEYKLLKKIVAKEYTIVHDKERSSAIFQK